ncbi:hypothetical protein GCM10008170_35500 [Methylopila capsulata]|uniref:Uncharacterized protein n=1 Tax=Methylopila capsulata TaxID=61654 RepID=A0A9W6IYB1_9HYPH|nr:hypothetical protein GCM10008170_35500 [Methylopila capsulata]
MDRDRILGKHRGGVKQRAVVLAAVEAVTEPDPVGTSRRHDPDIAAETTTCKSLHGRSPPVEVARGRDPPPAPNISLDHGARRAKKTAGSGTAYRPAGFSS